MSLDRCQLIIYIEDYGTPELRTDLSRGGGGSNFEGVQKSRDLSRDQKLVT